MKISSAKKLKNKRVVVLHSGAPNPNEGLVELELVLQILKDKMARPIEVFFSYFPYGMQDKVFVAGETNIAENLIKKLISYYGVNRIYIIDPHFWGRKWAEGYPLVKVSALQHLIKHAKVDFGTDFILVSPDKGGRRRTGIGGMKKTRIDSYENIVESTDYIKKKIRGRNVAIVDDLLETGGTLARFREECRRCGVNSCFALITHGVLESGISRVKKSFEKLYLTNTINHKSANVDITGIIAETLGSSVSG